MKQPLTKLLRLSLLACRQQQAEEGPESAAERATRTRSVYERAFRSLRESQPDAKEEAVMLLEAWKEAEASFDFRCGSSCCTMY